MSDNEDQNEGDENKNNNEEEVDEIGDDDEDPALVIIGGLLNDIEAKEYVPCPAPGTVPTIEAKAIVAKCVVCHVNQIQTVNFPCMHACFCIDCATPALEHSEVCPQCRTVCMHVAMLYLVHTDARAEDFIEHVHKKQKIETAQ